MRWLREGRRFSGIAYGEHFATRQADEVRRLFRLYGVPSDMDLQGLLLSIHTYFALLMKLIAAELIAISEPLVSGEAGPPVYLRDRMKPAARADYAQALQTLKQELREMRIPREDAADKTRRAMDGTLRDLASLGAG